MPTSYPKHFKTVKIGSQNYDEWCNVTLPLPFSHSAEVETCVWVAGPLDVTTHDYEFGGCNRKARNGIISWEAKPTATAYKLQQKLGSTWYTLQSSGSTHRATGLLGAGNYNYRVQAKNATKTGDWHDFTITVPHCGTGGPVPR